MACHPSTIVGDTVAAEDTDMDEHILLGLDAATDIPDFRKNVSVIQILFQAMKNNGESIAQIEADTGKTITFSDFLRQSINIAANLTRRGLTEGDTVLLCLEKSILAYCLLTGIIFTGATVALGKHDFSEVEFVHQLNKCQPKMMFCSEEMYKQMSPLEVTRKLEYFFPDGTSPDSKGNIFTDESDQEFAIHRVKDIDNHFPVISYTSGTSNLSKFVLIPNTSMQRYGFGTFRKMQRVLFIAPLSWASSIMTFVSSVINNYTMVLSVPDPVLHLQMTHRYKIDTWIIHPSIMYALMDVPDLPNYDLSSVELIISGGSNLSVHLKKTFLEKVFHRHVNIDHIYGSTETGVLTNYKDVDSETNENTASSGKLSSGVQLKVVDQNGRTVGPRVEGELRIKSLSMMKGYLRDPEATSRAFDAEGFFCTGDVGYYDDKGFIHPLGRVEDLIQYKGNMLSMAHVEGLLVTHPTVKDAVVVAKPHPLDNQHPAAFVVIKPNFKVNAEDIQKYIDDQVSDIYRLRGGVHFIDVIPKLPNSKVLKNVMRQKLLNNTGNIGPAQNV